MPLNRGQVAILGAAGIAGFSLLLLIISVGTPVWLDDGNGSTIGLFRQCYGNNISTFTAGCYSNNQVTQGGLSVFGLLLLGFAVITAIAAVFIQKPIVLWISLGLLYFASVFVMSAYATWGVYSRDESYWFFPNISAPATFPHTSMGYSYNLCVAAHYFLWTALTILAFGVGYGFSDDRGTGN